jgi:hypothetical protein
LGIWKDYQDMEDSISMPEFTSLLVAKREQDYEQRKFLAAIQGIDLDKESGKSKGQKEWEDIKARVFSRGQTTNSDDVVSLQGANATKSGFGIGAGLEYVSVKDSKNPKNPMRP